VCGRTILDGEQVRSYISAEGRHEVCELCAERTAEIGWLPAEQEGAEQVLRAEVERKPGFLARLFARPERPVAAVEEGEPAEPGGDPARPVPPASHELDTERHDVGAEWALEPDPPPAPDPAGRGMRPRRLQPDLSPASRFERAITRFNASEAGRTVAGLTRTLGAPSVSVGDTAGSADEVRVTVAWELTWYQWGVDLGDELRPVYELSKGFEVAEIDAAARQWNASAHDGRIVMVAPRRREAANGRPVHR
jgi:hypothetical protein